MGKTKKIVLFIVEGVTEQIALEGILSNLSPDGVRFKITNGDITSNIRSNETNIIKTVYNHVVGYIEREYIKKSDILQIVQLIDTDGAYIDDECVIQKDESDPAKSMFKNYYTPDSIEASDPEKMRLRNKKKSSLMNKLFICNSVEGIPYRAYFFSCNMDCVLHNNANMDNESKINCAYSFNDRFCEQPQAFIEFISQDIIAVSDTYTETWKYIQQGKNSLRRCSNFHLHFQ